MLKPSFGVVDAGAKEFAMVVHNLNGMVNKAIGIGIRRVNGRHRKLMWERVRVKRSEKGLLAS